MSLFLDALTVIVMGWIILISYRKGLIRSVIELAGYVAASVAAYVFSVPVGNWITLYLLKPLMMNKISGNVAQVVAGQDKSVLSGLSSISSFLSQYGIQTHAVAALSGSIQSGESALTGSIMNTVIAPLFGSIGRVVAFALIFAACMLLIRLVARVSDVVFRIPVIRQINGVGGAAVGVVKAFVIMFILSAIITIMIPAVSLQKNPPITGNTVNHTRIYKYIYRVNPLTRLLLKK